MTVSKDAAAMSLGVWAAKFVCESENWPVFLKWAEHQHPMGPVLALTSPEMRTGLLSHLAAMTVKANQR